MTPTLKHLAEETLRLDAEATPGPWHRETESRVSPASHFDYLYAGTKDGPGETVAQWALRKNAALIAHARTAAPALATALLKIMEAARELKREQDSHDLPPRIEHAIDSLLATLESP